MSDTFIQLGRTFHELSLAGSKDDEFDYLNVRVGTGLSWTDIFAEFRTVILSEAGAGKTAEIRHATQLLRNQGKAAFFLRLEHVAEDFEIAFEEGSATEFEQWVASDQEGWLLLDSVDEARLREPKDFERAIRKIGARLSQVLQRTHVILTSRGTAWRPVTDLKLCKQHLKYISPVARDDDDVETGDAAKQRSDFRIVALDDLGSRQVEIFARARKVTDPGLFVEAIERADAWAMAARPDDLNELVEFWDNHQRIGNRLELMQSSITRRLAERDQNRDEALPLSMAEAREGARSVAAAATMTQISTIRVPDGSENTSGTSVAAVLPKWDSQKCAALLSRPIFDEAIYQTVRFHHRTVREYLVAEWLKGLLDRETSRRRVEALLFREQYGLEVIVPTMRPVLVWLILLDEKIRERALAISPELIFEGGEPKALPLAVRQKILHEVCEKMHSSIVRNTMTDYRAVQRFADQDIAQDIKALFAKYPDDHDVQWFLLRMIWQGELAEVLPEAISVAKNPKARRHTRIAAIRAVRATGSDAEVLEIRTEFLKESPALNRELFAELIGQLAPTLQSVEWVLACAKKLETRDRNTIDRPPEALDAFVQSLDLEIVAVLMAGFNTLLSRHPVVGRGYCEISKRHGWMIKSAARAVERLIVAQHPAALQTPALSVLQKLPSAQYHRNWHLHDIKSDIPNLVPEWMELNDALFWYEVSTVRRHRRKNKKGRLTDFQQIAWFRSYWQFSPSDFERIKAYMLHRPLRDDRLVALTLAFSLYVQAQRPRKWREALKASVANSPALRAALHVRLHPLPSPQESRDWRRQKALWKQRDRKREMADAQRKQRWKDDLQQHITHIRDHGLADLTAITNRQYYLHERMRELDGRSMHWTTGNWHVLKAEFGDEIAHAFRDGVVAYWRNYSPKLRSESRRTKGTPFSVIFGLTGIHIEATETKNWTATLNDSEVEIAFRYAMHELNGFPEWMPALFQAFPDVIAPLLLREVASELKVEQAKVDSHYVLSDLAWHGSWAWRAIGKSLLARLNAREPKNLKNLGYMLDIIHSAGLELSEVARLAEKRSADRRHAHAARWFAVWAGIAPDKAIPMLALRLAAINNPARQAGFAMQFIVHLLGERRTAVKIGDAFRTPEHLKNLGTLMHQYIREKDDIRRAGTGAYSPGLRDDAQEARNQLFALLKEIPGKEAYLALMELAKLHPEPSLRPWMRHHAKTKAEADADLTPWTVAQTLDFQNALERTPSNHRELFELAQMRFFDLKDHLEHGDSSIADILIKGATLETDMRKFIGDWLRERAQGRYSIPQEEELADGKKPDLRIHGTGFDAPVPIELKLADNWSGSSLFERLENQLCGDYLRDARSGRGIFVLVYRGVKKRWTLLDTEKSVDFEALVAALQRHWHSLSEKFPAIEDIHVVGIDLTRR